MQARTLPFKALAGHCYLGEAKVCPRFREQISCSEMWHLHLFPESDCNSHQQDWLVMATIQS